MTYTSRSFGKNILLIYLVKGIGILTGFLSILMVVPRLTSNPEVYGIYTVCASLSLFFAYSDLGFLSAGQKFAAEYFAIDDLDREMEIIGFVLFFLALFVLVCILALIVIAYYPSLIISSANSASKALASKLILILVIFSPTIILQRFNSLVYSIRIEDFIYQSVDIIANLLKIISIQFFVTETSYDIVGYFFTIQVFSFLSASVGVYIAVRKFNYSISRFSTFLKFSRKIYDKTRQLAFSTLLTTIAWLLYFEFDSFILSKFYGLKIVAIYGLGFTLLSFLRTLYNTLFSPFLSRFNHFLGLGDIMGLQKNFSFLIKVTLPLCIIIPLGLAMNMEHIILTWIGEDYQSSVFICQLLVLTAGIGALNTPITYLIIANSQNYILRITAIILPVVFYGCLILLHPHLDYQSLAFAKGFTTLSSLFFTFYLFYTKIETSILNVYINPIIRTFICSLILVGISLLMPDMNNIEAKSLESYLILSMHIGPTIIIPLIVYFLSDIETRTFLYKLVNFRISKKELLY